MSGRIIRVIMFKIPAKENQLKMAELYKTLSATAIKDGKPYILSLHAGPAFKDVRSDSYTFVAKTEFGSIDDMTYYLNECESHKTLQLGAQSLGIEGVMMVYYDPTVVSAS